MTTAIVCAYSPIGREALAGLLDIGVEILALYTYPQKPGESWFTPPATIANKFGIPIFMESNFNENHVYNRIKSVKLDFLFSFYFREMIQTRFLRLPLLGAYNIHGSLLPKYRGQNPINWVILKGEKQTGITMHAMTSKPDEGDIFGQITLPIAWDETALSLTQRSATASRELVHLTIPKLIDGHADSVSQKSLGTSTYFGGRKPEDGILNLDCSAEIAFNLIRAVADPWPNAFFKTHKGIVKVSWALPTTAFCPTGCFRETKDGVVVGFNDSSLRIHTLRKDDISSECPIEHANWLRWLGLPQTNL